MGPAQRDGRARSGSTRVADTSHHQSRASARDGRTRGQSRQRVFEYFPDQLHLEPRRRGHAQQRRRDRRGGPGLPADPRGGRARSDVGTRDPDAVLEAGRRPGRGAGHRGREGRAPAHGRPEVLPRRGATSARPSGCSARTAERIAVLPAGPRPDGEVVRAGRPGDHPGRGAVRGRPRCRRTSPRRARRRRAGADDDHVERPGLHQGAHVHLRAGRRRWPRAGSPR